MTELTSVNNNRVKDIAKLMKSAKSRREKGLFIAEGMRLVAEVPPERLAELYIEDGFPEKLEREEGYKDRIQRLVERAEERGLCFRVSTSVMQKMSDTDTPQGIMAVVRMNSVGQPYGAGTKKAGAAGADGAGADGAGTNGAGADGAGADADGAGADGAGANGAGSHQDYVNQHDCRKQFYIIVDRLQDPGNMGTIIRTAEGAGVTDIIVSRDSVDPYSPKVVRSAMGSLFRMKISISDDLVGDIRALREKGVKVCGTHLSGVEFYDEDFSGDIAFLIGNEGSGLSDEVSAEADTLLRIPMEGQVESLNAAVSAAVVMYEVLRQRRESSI